MNCCQTSFSRNGLITQWKLKNQYYRILCKVIFDISYVGVFVLNSNADGNRLKVKFWKNNNQLTLDFLLTKKWLTTSSTAEKNKEKGTFESFAVNENTLSDEILWYLKLVLSHNSYNPLMIYLPYLAGCFLVVS